MGAPVSGLQAASDSSAETLLSGFDDIAAPERRRHATVFNYWLSIRRDRQFPPIRDLDPLEISDAGPCSVLLELIGGGEDADIRHQGQAIKDGPKVERISEAACPSLLSCIAERLPEVSRSKQALAFADEFEGSAGLTRCWVTLLPFSSTGTYVDYVYGFVSLGAGAVDGEAQAEPEDAAEAEAAPKAKEAPEAEVQPEDPEAYELENVIEAEAAIEDDFVETENDHADLPEVPLGRLDEEEPEAELQAPIEEAEAKLPEQAPSVFDEPEEEIASELEPEAVLEDEVAEAAPELEPVGEEPIAETPEEKRHGFSAKLLGSLATVGGFYGKVVEVGTNAPADPEQQFEENLEEPNQSVEGPLQTKLADVRAKADEARMAKLRSNAALYEGLSAAYDFALDAEDKPEEYLKLVEEQGLKIQLRSPMQPVVKLAFGGLCDDATIAQLEAVLAWALKQDLPRGSLAEHIESQGGLGQILNGSTRAAA
jgi:hypothetical protein